MNLRQVVLFTGLTQCCLSACARAQERSARLIGTPETRQIFQITTDTMPEAAAGVTPPQLMATVREYVRGMGFSNDSVCIRVFRADSTWLVYALDRCRRPAGVATVEDGDALLQLDHSGRRVLQVLLNPGGIAIEEVKHQSEP